jgi:predicted small metal-binding protein
MSARYAGRAGGRSTDFVPPAALAGVYVGVISQRPPRGRGGDTMKKVEMEQVLRCADVTGTSCQFVARGQTMDEILQQAGQHAVEGHGLTVTPELVEAVKARVTQA